MPQEPPKPTSRLVRLGIVVVTLVMGLYVLSSLFKNFSHLMAPPPATTSVEHAPPAP